MNSLGWPETGPRWIQLRAPSCQPPMGPGNQGVSSATAHSAINSGVRFFQSDRPRISPAPMNIATMPTSA